MNNVRSFVAIHVGADHVASHVESITKCTGLEWTWIIDGGCLHIYGTARIERGG